MTSEEFVKKSLWIAKDLKTLYVLGAFGEPLSSVNKLRLINKNIYNNRNKDKINNATSDTFGFDCVCLIKSILWGFNGDVTKLRGGAIYCSNGVADVNADVMMTSKYCNNLSTNFKNIKVGELVGMKGHIGIYIGNGKVVESTSAFENKVIVTEIGEDGTRSYKGKKLYKWYKHGELKYLNYHNKKSIKELASEVIDGLWGNGKERKEKLEEQGYNYDEVQSKVNEILKPKKEINVGSSVFYKGYLYRDSFGNGRGSYINGNYKVSIYIKNRKCGVHLSSLGWVSENNCKVLK